MLTSSILVGDQDVSPGFKLPFLAIPPLMMLARAAMLKFGGRNAPEHEEQIHSFLTDKVKASEQRPPGERLYLADLRQRSEQ